MKAPVIIIAFLLALTFQAIGQKSYTSPADVYSASEIRFYGYDFNSLKLAETKRMGEDLKQQLYAWVDFCQKHITDEKLTAWFRKEKVSVDYSPTVEPLRSINGERVVTYEKNVIPQDSLQSIVGAYILKEKEGIGMVVILECLDKPTNKTSAYFTFFDIASRKILKSDYVSEKEVDGYGLTNYWGVSIVGITKNYASAYRKSIMK